MMPTILHGPEIIEFFVFNDVSFVGPLNMDCQQSLKCSPNICVLLFSKAIRKVLHIFFGLNKRLIS